MTTNLRRRELLGTRRYPNFSATAAVGAVAVAAVAVVIAFVVCGRDCFCCSCQGFLLLLLLLLLVLHICVCFFFVCVYFRCSRFSAGAALPPPMQSKTKMVKGTSFLDFIS